MKRRLLRFAVVLGTEAGAPLAAIWICDQNTRALKRRAAACAGDNAEARREEVRVAPIQSVA